MIIILLLATVVSLSIANLTIHGDCNRQKLGECLRSMQEMSSDPSMSYAASEDVLNDVCKKVDEGLECAHNYTARCLSHRQQEIHRKTMNGAIQVLGDLCTHGKFRQSFLKHSPCLRQASIGDNRCIGYYNRLMEHTKTEFRMTGDDTNAHSLRTSCCVYSEFVACSTNEIAAVCGEEAAEFVARYTRRAAGALIHRHCADFLVDARCDSGTQSSSGLLFNTAAFMSSVLVTRFL